MSFFVKLGWLEYIIVLVLVVFALWLIIRFGG